MCVHGYIVIMFLKALSQIDYQEIPDRIYLDFPKTIHAIQNSKIHCNPNTMALPTVCVSHVSDKN